MPDLIERMVNKYKMENVIYRVILKRSEACKRPNVCIYYDENMEKAIAEMRKYVKANGFTVYDRDGRFTVSDILISKETPTGKILCIKPYRAFFDIYGNRKNTNDRTEGNK